MKKYSGNIGRQEQMQGKGFKTRKDGATGGFGVEMREIDECKERE